MQKKKECKVSMQTHRTSKNFFFHHLEMLRSVCLSCDQSSLKFLWEQTEAAVGNTRLLPVVFILDAFVF